MKKIIIMAICLVVSAGVFAQGKGFSWGVKAGMNIADFIGKDVKNTDMKIAYNVGVVTEFGITEKFAIGPELVFSAQGYNVKVGDETAKFNAQYITLPIMAKYYVIDKLSINLGPQLGYAVSMKSKVGSTSQKLDKDLYNAFDLSIGVGATYHFWKMFADVRYNYGLTNILKESNVKNSVIQIGVGYKF